MARKPASMYRYIKGHPSTRREYMGGIPASRISQFVMGNKNADFPVHLSLLANEKCQIRHNTLEAVRITVNRVMEKKVGSTNYRIRVRVYPHAVLRENKQATGAGADRVSQGMRASFGKIVGTAAQVKQDQVILTIETLRHHISHAKSALRKAGIKISPPCRIDIKEHAS